MCVAQCVYRKSVACCVWRFPIESSKRLARSSWISTIRHWRMSLNGSAFIQRAEIGLSLKGSFPSNECPLWPIRNEQRHMFFHLRWRIDSSHATRTFSCHLISVGSDLVSCEIFWAPPPFPFCVCVCVPPFQLQHLVQATKCILCFVHAPFSSYTSGALNLLKALRWNFRRLAKRELPHRTPFFFFFFFRSFHHKSVVKF